MPLNGTEVYKNRVMASCVVTGTANYATFTTIPTYNSANFAAFTNTDRVVYSAVAVDVNGNPTGTDWEVGVGVIGTMGTVITRTDAEILASSNAGVRVSWATSSLVRVACVAPAETLLQARTNGTSIKSADQTLSSTSFADVTDLTVTFPSAGTYYVSVTLNGLSNVTGAGGVLTGTINVNGSDVTDADFSFVQSVASQNAVMTSTRNYIVTVSDTHVCKVRAKRNTNTSVVSSIIQATGAYRSSMTWFRMY